jgi:hypothetical protein
MPKAFFFSAILLFAVATFEAARAQAQCDDGYALCMSGCATERLPERCMQRCQEAERRCAKSGVFKMPIGFLLNKSRLRDMSYAEGELPQVHRKTGDVKGARPLLRR